MNFIKSHWKLIGIFIITIIVLVYIGSVTGTNRKLFNMLVDQLREDQTQIIKDKNEWIKTCEEEIIKINAEKEKIAKEKALAQQSARVSAAEVSRLKGENHALQDLIDHLLISDDPDQLISDLQRRGIKIRRSLENR